MEGSGVDVREQGANQQVSERRLFMQLQVWTGCSDGKPLVARARSAAGIEARALPGRQRSRAASALLTIHEDPAFFASALPRGSSHAAPFAALRHRPELTMLGRTYASGFEPDLEDWLLARPRRTVLNPAWPWGIWYPLRRTGAFARLRRRSRGRSCASTAMLGRAYGEADLAHDVRLACHGLDTHDNDFVIGLVGRELHPLSHLVQAMRKTAQTSQYLQTLGPFFVGHALWQSPSR